MASYGSAMQFYPGGNQNGRLPTWPPNGSTPQENVNYPGGLPGGLMTWPPNGSTSQENVNTTVAPPGFGTDPGMIDPATGLATPYPTNPYAQPGPSASADQMPQAALGVLRGPQDAFSSPGGILGLLQGIPGLAVQFRHGAAGGGTQNYPGGNQNGRLPTWPPPQQNYPGGPQNSELTPKPVQYGQLPGIGGISQPTMPPDMSGGALGGFGAMPGGVPQQTGGSTGWGWGGGNQPPQQALNFPGGPPNKGPSGLFSSTPQQTGGGMQSYPLGFGFQPRAPNGSTPQENVNTLPQRGWGTWGWPRQGNYGNWVYTR